MTPQVCGAQLLERSARIRRLADYRSDYLMRLDKRYPVPDQVFREVGRQRKSSRRRTHAFGIESKHRPELREQVERRFERVDRAEDAFLVFLQIGIVSERESFEDSQHRDQVADDSSRLAADQFEQVRIFLLRHHRTAGGKFVRQRGESELGAGPQNNFLAHARKMHLRERSRRDKIHDEVAIRHRVDAVGGDRFETERTRDHPAIKRKCGRGQRARAERHHRSTRARLLESLAVAAEHLDVGEQMMRQRYRLRALQMSVAGHDRTNMPLRKPDEDAAKSAYERDYAGNLVAKI